MNGAVTGPFAIHPTADHPSPSPRPRPHDEDRDGGPPTERDAVRESECADFWRAWQWPEPDEPLAVPHGRVDLRERSDVAALLPDDVLDPDTAGDRRWWRRGARDRPRASPTSGRGARRALAAVGTLAVLSGGFLAGVVVDRAVSADALDTARAAGSSDAGASFDGRVEADVSGTLAVVSPDGRRRSVRTSPGTEVVSMNLLPGDLPPGTPVQVRTRPGADGTPEATQVAVTGGPTGAGGTGAVVSGP